MPIGRSSYVLTTVVFFTGGATIYAVGEVRKSTDVPLDTLYSPRIDALAARQLLVNGLTSQVDFGPRNLSVWDLTVLSWKK
jgi:hypothetical protein